MKFQIKQLEELIGGEKVGTNTDLEVEIPDRAVRVGEAMVFEDYGWSSHPGCSACREGQPCLQLVAVWMQYRTAKVEHCWTRKAGSGPYPWSMAEPK
jgi:hypothetical protein